MNNDNKPVKGKLAHLEAELAKSNIIFIQNPDPETPLSIVGPHIRVDWYEAGEGYFGDYNPDNPDDCELLRFDVYRREDEKSDIWEDVEDASYCTAVPVGTDTDKLKELLYVLYEEYADVLEDDPTASVKKLGEALSWIGSM